jgi:NAD(P)-dependent dehydrogenase (short-subunit alcohol dehydrogenase family)
MSRMVRSHLSAMPEQDQSLIMNISSAAEAVEGIQKQAADCATKAAIAARIPSTAANYLMTGALQLYLPWRSCDRVPS